MSVWSDVFLGVIAVATLAMAIGVVGVFVAAGRLARRVGRLLDQVELEMKPIFSHMNAIGHDASLAAALATAQVERFDGVFADLARRVDQTVHTLQDTLAAPAREGRAVLSALKAAVRAVRDGASGRRTRSDEEDVLFI